MRDVGPAGLHSIPLSDIYAQSRGLCGSDQHLASAPFKCILRLVITVFFQKAEDTSADPQATWNSRNLGMGAARGLPGPRILAEDGGFTAALPGDLKELFEGTQDDWVLESINRVLAVRPPSRGDEQLRANATAAQTESQIANCWGRFATLAAFPLLQGVATLCQTGVLRRRREKRQKSQPTC